MKFRRNYDTEIMELNQKTTGLRTDTDNNKTEIISIGNEFGRYKLEKEETFNEIFETLKSVTKECSELRLQMKAMEEEKKKESEIKQNLPNVLTCDDICSEITGVKGLDKTTLKYYLYELDLLTLKINKYRNTYRVVPNYKDICTEISSYMDVNSGIITFDKNVLPYFKSHFKDLQNSVDRYLRKNIQYSKSKDRIDALKVNNYQTEICNICGTDSNGNYDATKWGQIYSRYSIEHKNWRNEYNKWADNYMTEHPRAKYRPTQITYLVQKVGDGDILLKIACELFVA